MSDSCSQAECVHTSRNGAAKIQITANVVLLVSQNMSDAMAVLHKLQTGLDVNVKFTGVRVFEYTPECIVFDLLDIPLYHGWLVDPQVRSNSLISAPTLHYCPPACP